MADLYKVLVDGKSCHGGELDWSLPTRNDDGSYTPGEWMRVGGDLILCANAIHLTDQPSSWFLDGAQCWRAEYRGDTVGELLGSWDSKIGVREARLLAPVSWETVGVWTTGHHTLRAGFGRAYDSASVTASGSASVRASDSASVTASDSASVRAYGSASVRAYGSASVTASGSASVRAYDSASVTASGSASVRAYDSASVTSTDWHSKSATVALSHMAAHIDRRGGKLVLRSAQEATDGR